MADSVCVAVTILAGSITCRPVAPAATSTEKLSVAPFQDSDLNDEPFLPSSHSSNWRAEMTGTPRVCADATIIFAVSDAASSACIAAVKTPGIRRSEARYRAARPRSSGSPDPHPSLICVAA